MTVLNFQRGKCNGIMCSKGRELEILVSNINDYQTLVPMEVEGVEQTSGVGSLQSYPGWLPKVSGYVSHGPYEPGSLSQSLVSLAWDPQQLVHLSALGNCSTNT